MSRNLADMRRDYTRDGLSEEQAPDEPFALFHQWFAEAVKTEQAPVEPNAMHLATVDQAGRPHCRVLLLKGLDENGFTFFTNYASAKGEELRLQGDVHGTSPAGGARKADFRTQTLKPWRAGSSLHWLR